LGKKKRGERGYERMKKKNKLALIETLVADQEEREERIQIISSTNTIEAMGILLEYCICMRYNLLSAHKPVYIYTGSTSWV
jgi:hypothetical protein